MDDMDAVAVAPDVYRVILENDRVRVLDVTGIPGTVTPMHDHPDSVMHSLADATIAVTAEDGSRTTVDVKAGATFWSPAATHAVENAGATTVRFIRVELKEQHG